EVDIGRRDHARVALNFLPAADSLEALLLQKAQKLHLDRWRQLADFVEEQRAALGGFDVSLALYVRAGERPLLVGEQLAFEQVLRDGVAVDRDERTLVLRAAGVERPRDHFLAGAAFAQDQDRRGRARHLTDEGKDGLH